MKVKIKKLHPDAVIPSYSKKGDAGMDLTIVNNITIENISNYGTIECHFGIAMEIPKGYVGLIFPRSSIYKSTLRLSNAVGVIDSGYRGELRAQLDLSTSCIMAEDNEITEYKGKRYVKGDRVAQMIIIPYPQIEFEEVEQLSETERGTKGYGSSGN